MRMRGNTPISITLDRRIWTRMAGGRTRRTTARCGFRTSRMTGLLIAMATGLGSPITVGRGWATSLGGGRLITTGGGCGTAGRGHGGRDRCGEWDFIVRSGRRRMFRSLDSEADGDSVSDGEDGAALDGCRLGLATASIRGGADMADGLEWRGPVDLALTAASAGLRRCTVELNFRMWRISMMRTSAAAYRRWGRGNLG